MTGHAELIAFYELTQAKAAYRRALDTRDWNGLTALMTPDVEFGMSNGEFNGTSVTGYGHYTDRWVRRADEWKLASSRLTHLITDVHQATDESVQ